MMNVSDWIQLKQCYCAKSSTQVGCIPGNGRVMNVLPTMDAGVWP